MTYVPLIEKAILESERRYGALIAVKLINKAWNQLPHKYQSNNNPYEQKLEAWITRYADAALEIDTIEASYVLLRDIRTDVPSSLRAGLAQKCIAPLTRASNADPMTRYILWTEALDQAADFYQDILNDEVFQTALQKWLDDYDIRFISNHTSDEPQGTMRSERSQCLDSYRILFCRLSNYAGEPLMPLIRQRLETTLEFTERQAGQEGIMSLSELFQQQADMVHDVRLIRNMPTLERPAEAAIAHIFERFGVFIPS